jgi:hypothetical protein
MSADEFLKVQRDIEDAELFRAGRIRRGGSRGWTPRRGR